MLPKIDKLNHLNFETVQSCFSKNLARFVSLFIMFLLLVSVTGCLTPINPTPEPLPVFSQPVDVGFPESQSIITQQVISNCSGSSNIQMPITGDHDFEQIVFGENDFSIQASMRESGFLTALQSLPTANGQESLEITAEPGSNIVYTLSWTGIYQPSEITVKFPDGQSDVIKILYLVDVKVDIVNIETQSCNNINVTPASTPVTIAELNVTTEVTEDGRLMRTAALSLEPLGLGDLQLNAPAMMVHNESDVVELLISPSQALTSLPRVNVSPSAPPGLSSSSPAPDYSFLFEDEIHIYPVMQAVLEGVNFDIKSDGEPLKSVDSSTPIGWVWNITPRNSGKQSLVLYISIPVTIEDNEIARPLKNISLDVEVMAFETPTPIPTDTPAPTPTKTAVKRAVDNVADNMVALIGSVLVFIVGMIGAWVGVAKYRDESKKRSFNSVNHIDPKNLTVEGIRREVNKINDVDLLKKWLAEENRQSKPREGAVNTINERLNELQSQKPPT